MSLPELGAVVPPTGSIPAGAGVEVAQNAEAAGFEYVFVPETWGRDAVSRLGYIAARTDRINLGTGIVPVHSRSPALLAQSIATLDELSSGRAVLGLGVSSPEVIESWHGAGFEPALRRQRETIEIVRAALLGDEVEYEGQVFDLSGFRLRFSPVRADVPILVAAQGETNAELTGGFADGWIPNRIPRSAIQAVRTHVDRGAELRDRDPEEVRTFPYVTTCVLEDGALARERCREVIAFYIGAMGDFHFRALADHGFRDEAERIRDRWQAGDTEDAREAVGDTLLAEIAIAGTPSEAEESLARYENIADAVGLLFPTTAAAAEITETIEHVGAFGGG